MSEETAGRSTVKVGLGLLVLGLSASVYLVLAGRATGPAAFAGLAVQWTLIYTVGMGLFVPFEQEVAREVAGRRARGEGAGPVLRRGALFAALLCLALTVVVLAALPWTFETLWYSSPAHVVGFLLACVGLAGQYLQRGAFSGSGRFAAYSTQLLAEGLVRLVGTAVLFATGVGDPAPYALLVGIAPLVSVALVASGFLRLVRTPGGRVSWRSLTRNLAWLVAAALAAQGLANLGTVAVRVLGSSLPDASTGHFMSGLTVARLPLFAFAAVQAVLLPRLAATLADGRHRSFRVQLLTTMAWTGALAGAGLVGTLLLGPEVLGLLFGAGFDLPRSDLVYMAAATAVYMIALVLQPAVIALGGHRANAVGWVSGVAVFALTLALPMAVFGRVELALVLGGAATTLVLGWYVATRTSGAGDLDLEHDPAVDRVGME